MFARVTTFQGMPEQQDEATRYAAEHVIPTLQRSAGFMGFYWLGDRQGGTALAVTLWEDEEAMRASEGQAERLRIGVDQAAGSNAGNVGKYEVVLRVGAGRGSLPPIPTD